MLAGPAFLTAAATSTFQGSGPGVDRLVTTLFLCKFDFEKGDAWQREHRKALDYVHHVSQTQLKTDLGDVVRRRGLRSTAGAAATYLMVLHGIDPKLNLARLVGLHGDCSEEVEASIPDALADIAIQLNSRRAARDLVGMRNGDYEAEDQAIAIHRLFLARPGLVVSVSASSPALRKNLLLLLPFGAWNAQVPLAPAKRVAAKMARFSRGTELQVFRQIAGLPDYARS